MVKTSEIYDYIKLGNTAMVQEYISQFNNVANKLNLDILQNLLAHAIDWKHIDIIKLLIENSANPEMTNRFASYYATQNTNGLPSIEILAYLSQNQTLEEYVGCCRNCNLNLTTACKCNCNTCNTQLVYCKCK